MISDKADKIIQRHVILSMGISVVPIPLIDIVLVCAIHHEMLKQLSIAYNKNNYEQRNEAFISGIATASAAKLGSSLIKIIPGVGTVAGGLSSAVINGATTYALGRVTARFFHENIDIADIDLDLAKEFFKEEFEIGKQYASNLRNQKKNIKEMDLKAYAEQLSKEEKILKKLINIKKLLEDGHITQAEYEKLRVKYVKQMDL